MKSNQFLSIYISLSIVVCGLSGCTHEIPTPAVIVEVADDSCGVDVTYLEDIEPIISTACAISGCHEPAGFKDFSTYTALKAQLDSRGTMNFLSRIGPGGGMPPSYTTGPKTISACDYSKINTWLNQGYPDN